MNKRVKKAFKQNKILIENFSFLGVLQFSNLFVSFITIPYLFRILGNERYGLIIFAQTIAIYLSILINFGFNITSTRDISIHIVNKNIISEIITKTILLKLFLFASTLIIMSLLTIFVPIINLHSKIFFYSMLFCLSEALFPIWYFQGIEKLKYITFISLGTRLSSAILIFILIKHPSNYHMVPVVLGIGTNLGAFIGLFIVFKSHNHNLKFPTILTCIKSFKENSPLFISNLSSQIYVNANKVILGSTLGLQEVAIYDVIEKIINLVKLPFTLIYYTLFPRISRFKETNFILNIMKYVFLIYMIIFIGIQMLANYLVYIFSGNINYEAASLLRLFSISIFPICISIFLGELLIVPFGFFKVYTKMKTLSMLLYLVIIGLLFYMEHIGIQQLIITVLIVETFVAFYSYYLYKRYISK